MDFRSLPHTMVIAEVGVNHEGDLDVALDLIRQAAACGVDAVKFTTFRIDHYISTEQAERKARIARFELGQEAFRRMAEVARECGIIWFSTGLDRESVDFLATIQPLMKIASGDLNNTTFIRHIVSKGLPTIISTGYGDEGDVTRAVEAALAERPSARDDGSIMLMHCVGAYPTADEHINIRNMDWLRDAFGLPVGFSDHTIGIKACELATAAGAVAVEKHFTYRATDQAWHDHALSAEPDDMRALIKAVREAEKFMGRRQRILDVGIENRLTDMRRSVGAAADIPAGVPLRREWLTWLRPAWGMHPDRIDAVVGQTLKRPLKAGELLREDDLEG